MLRQILWIVFVVIAGFWLFGALIGFLGGLIHIALVAAVVLVVYNVFFASHTKTPRYDETREITRY